MNKSLVCLVLLAACSKTAEEAEQANGGLAYAAKDARKAIAHGKAMLTAGTPDTRECSAMANLFRLKESEPHHSLAAELEKQCTEELPLAIIELETAKAEAARKADPKGALMEHCYNAEVAKALFAMRDAGKRALADDKLARFKAACPDRLAELR